MPICDAYISEGALSADAERDLLATVTDLMLEHEGVDPTNEQARLLTWVFVHRHEMYVAGSESKHPRYRFDCYVPEGQYNEERRAAMTAEVTKAVVDAEAGSRSHPELRVAVFTYEIKDGWWGGGGRTLRLPDIYEVVLGGAEGRAAGEEVLAERRRHEAEQVIALAGQRLPR
jgi:phenylpyruvate tautomerase PptA (4-oxalocrotonate tautomerase family)